MREDVNQNRLTTVAFLLAAFLTAAGCGRSTSTASGPRFIRQVEWAERGVWLKADTHTHTRFSDGAHTVAEVADQAAQYGCDVLAITDHADCDLTAGTHEYIEAIKAARRQHSDLVVLAGLEWNIPPYDGDEHVVILFPPGPGEGQDLADFKARFDDLGREEHDPSLAGQGLEWLASLASADGVSPLAIYEHPSRKRQSTNQIVGEVRRWRAINDVVIGLSGAPGHQGKEPIGAYNARLKTVGRWDPAVANVGDAWDKLLEKELDVWGAGAPSDFHDDRPDSLGDYWPGQFSETWLYAPDRTAEGAIKALRAGTFFGAHGHIAREVQLRVEAEGLARPAIAGESIEVPRGSQVSVRLEYKTPDADWMGRENRIESVELIGVMPAGANSLAQECPAGGGPAFETIIDVPDGGIVLRARGGRGDLMFYTNPVRVRAASAAPLASQQATSPETTPLKSDERTWVSFLSSPAAYIAGLLMLGCVGLASGRRAGKTARGIRVIHTFGCFAVAVGLVASMETLLLHVPSIPYNVRELLGTTPVTPVAIAVSILATGWVSMCFACQWWKRPLLFAWQFPILLTLAAAAVYKLLRSTTPLESLHDIVGSPILEISYELEMCGRFAGLYAGVVSGLTLGARLAIGKPWRLSWAGLLAVGAMAFASYSVVVLAACTDNIVELMRGEGNAVAGLALLGWFACLGFSAAETARSMGRQPSGARSLARLALVLSLASLCGWWLLVAGTTPKLDKYNTTFSAMQFLLGPDRGHHLSTQSLLVRFVALQVGLTLFLGWGMVFGTRPSAWGTAVGAGQAGRRQTKLPDMSRAEPAHLALLFPRRRHYAAFFLGFLAFAVYGSLVPLDFHAHSFAEAWSRFRDIPYLHLSIASRSDWVANILLFMPIGYCGLAAWTCERRSKAALVAAAILIVAFCIVLSVALEFTQIWFPPRTVSQNDIVAESIGSIVGVALWCALGRTTTAWLRSFTRRRSRQERFDWLLQAYVAGLCLYSLFPLDVTINPNEFQQKYEEGRFRAIPFAGFQFTSDECFALVSDLLLFVPVGMFAARVLARRERPLRSFGKSWLLGMGIALTIELAGVFVYSRFTDATELICAAVGVAVGAKWRRRQFFAGEAVTPVSAAARRKAAVLWLCAAGGYAALLVAIYLLPFPMIDDSPRIARRWHGFFGVPLASLYWRSEYNAVTQVLRDWLLFAPLGVAAARLADLTAAPKRVRVAVLASFLMLALLLAVGIEIGQIWRDRTTANFTEALLCTFGAAAGMFLTRRLTQPTVGVQNSLIVRLQPMAFQAGPQ